MLLSGNDCSSSRGFQGGVGRFHSGRFVGQGFRGGPCFQGNSFVLDVGCPGYWSYYSAGWSYPYYGYPYYGYPNYSYYSYPYYGYGYYPYSAYAYRYYGYSYPAGQTTQTICPESDGAPLYLIKLTYEDEVWVARDYWYTAGTLNFVTFQRELNKTPISSIDRALTFQFNRACGLNFQFPR
jgi:hypothetical protein